MQKFKTAIVAALVLGTTLLAGCGPDLKPSDKTCTAAYINEIAQKEGVEKAKSLSAACLEQGYDKAMNDLQKAGDAIKEKLFGEKK